MSRTLEVSRLRRALALHVEPIAPGRFRVSGGREPHEVRDVSGQLCCGCHDAVFHPRASCKHATAVVLFDRLGAELFAFVRDAVAGAP